MYIIHYNYGDRFECGDFDTVKEMVKQLQQDRYHVHQVLGDGYDYDCDERGYHLCCDGLTDDERDEIETLL